MSFEFIKKLPTPAEIRKELPLPAELARIKEERDAEIRDVLTGKSNKFLVIIGPCSADNEDSVCDYVNRLARVNEKVKDKLILVPRIYTNKPRTTGEGYKGITSQPDPEKKPDFLAGLMAMRKMHIRAIKETGLTAADEMLYPENWGLCIRYPLLCGHRCPFRRGSAASSDRQRLRCSCRYEESYQRRFLRNAELRICGTAPPLLHLYRMGGEYPRQRSGTHRTARCYQQARCQYPQLPLRGSDPSVGYV